MALADAASDDDLLLAVGAVPGLLRLGRFPRLSALLRARFAPFLLPRSSRIGVRWTLRLEEAPPRGSARSGGGPAVRIQEGRIEVARRDYEAVWMRSAGGRRAIWEGIGRCAFHPVSAESMLRVFLSVLFPREGGALVHAAAARIGGAGVLLPGASGAGKSTLAGKAGVWEEVLSDELAPVRREGNGPWRVYGSPFWGGYARGGLSMRGWPLSLIAFPRQAARLVVTPLAPAETAQRLLGAMLSYDSGKAVAEAMLDLATRIAAAVPGVELATARETPGAAIRDALAVPLRGRGIDDDPSASRRERIAELRACLARDGIGAFCAGGDSMRPAIRDGDTVFVVPARASASGSGDLLLYWKPGPFPDDDRLVCHRVVARAGTGPRARLVTKGDNDASLERFTDGREAEVLGRVVAVFRGGRVCAVPGRAGRLLRLAGSLAALPLQRLRAAPRGR